MNFCRIFVNVCNERRKVERSSDFFCNFADYRMKGAASSRLNRSMCK